MNEKQIKAMYNELRHMNNKQLEELKKKIDEIIKRYNKLMGVEQ